MFDVHFFCLFIIEIKLSMGECSYLKKKKKVLVIVVIVYYSYIIFLYCSNLSKQPKTQTKQFF